jgi:neutral ceramidase
MNRRDFFKTGAILGANPPLSLRLAAQAGVAPVSGQKIGFAERDITPSLGMEIPGGYGKAFHRSFHDPCKVRAAVFDDGERRVALVGVDALMVPRHLVLAARKEILARSGIAENAVLIGASHSHSSGPVGMVQPGEYDHASPLVRKLAYEFSSCADPGYLLRVQAAIVQAVVEADQLRQEAACAFGLGREDKVAFNRRLRMKNGQTWSHPGKGNPEIVGYAGPIDPDVGVLGAWDRHGRLLGCVVHYACHATTNPGGISANWIYYLEQTIQGVFGKAVNVVFLQGDCGDITQVDNLSPYANPPAEQWARLVGGRVGAEAVKVLLSAYPGGFSPVAAAASVRKMKRRIPNPERVRRSLEIVQRSPKEVDATEWTFAKEIVLLDALIAKEPEAEVEVQAVQVGPAVFIARPGEMFVEHGLEIKKNSPFPLTFPVELANGCAGYIPTEEALGPHGGGYETRLTSYSNLVPSAGREMTAMGLDLARSFRPAAIPEPPKAPPFKAPWSYGNVPPELS